MVKTQYVDYILQVSRSDLMMEAFGEDPAGEIFAGIGEKGSESNSKRNDTRQK
jgi:hypothetical protein